MGGGGGSVKPIFLECSNSNSGEIDKAKVFDGLVKPTTQEKIIVHEVNRTVENSSEMVETDSTMLKMIPTTMMMMIVCLFY